MCGRIREGVIGLEQRGEEDRMSNENTGSGLGIILGVLGLFGLAYYFNRKKCPKCQFENPPESTHCHSCGEQL